MDNTEKDIINGIKQGDEQAFRYLFDHHYALLCQISASFLKDDFLAETIVGMLFFIYGKSGKHWTYKYLCGLTWYAPCVTDASIT